MPRMFDMLKGEGQTPRPKPKKAAQKKDSELTVSFPRQIQNTFSAGKQPEASSQTSRELIDAINKKSVDDNKIAKEKYHYALSGVKTLIKKVSSGERFEVFIDEIYKIVDALTNQLILGDSLLQNITQEYTPENYFAQHATNVCILSLAVGMQMNFNKSKLHTLSIATIFHDIGMLDFKEIVKQPRQLSDEEYREVRAHVSKSAVIFVNMEGPYDVIKEIIEQHHERVNGRGYPLGIRGHEINEYAKIVGLVDTYEAMTHSRPHRQAEMPHTAIRETMGPSRSLFEPEIIKALVDKLSIYPVGSFVRLNSGEIAKVVSSNSASVLRPRILVILDAYGKHLSELKIIDLSQSDSVYIKEPAFFKDTS